MNVTVVGNTNKSSKVVDEQPDFGKHHIKSKKDLKVGMKVNLHHAVGSPWEVQITELMDTKFTSKVLSKDWDTDAYYSDMGLTPYEHGLWNDTNWVERI